MGDRGGNLPLENDRCYGVCIIMYMKHFLFHKQLPINLAIPLRKQEINL